jgi:hypothetical protein
VQQVLFEESAGGYFTGHCPNYVRVYAPGEDLQNHVRTVVIGEPYKDGVLGQIVC